MVRLLHLSDLHFSRDIDHFHFAEHNPENIANLIIHKLMGKPPEYIVISGDLTYSGAITEFSFVQEFLLSLLDGFGLKPEKDLLFVLGNRDIDKLEKYEREQPYNDFFHNVLNRPIVKASSLLIRDDITLLGYDAVFNSRHRSSWLQ
jgi:3',5'-cyclic AMP phosphodiesterase CpdA